MVNRWSRLVLSVAISASFAATFSSCDDDSCSQVPWAWYCPHDAGPSDLGPTDDSGTISPDSGVNNQDSGIATQDSGAAAVDSGAGSGSGSGSGSNSECALYAVDLLGSESFAVLAGSTVTSTGLSIVTGDLGVSPGTAIVGFPPGQVVGDIHSADPYTAQAKLDLTSAYNDAAGRSPCPVTVAGNLGGQTLPPGLYKSTSSLAISSGDLTLDAKGDPGAVFIFQIASSFTTTSGRQVILAGGADPSNIFWQVGSSATFGTGSVVYGSVMAYQSISVSTGATIVGRVLAMVGAVTLQGNIIGVP